MIDERPDALLKSALEKIVYFEARSEQLSNDLHSARTEVERCKLDLAGAAQREIELRRHVAEQEVRAQRAHSEREQMGRVVEALRAERAALIGKLIEASRIHGSSRPDDDDERFDLASFISELRSEALEKRGSAAPLYPQPSPPSPFAFSGRPRAQATSPLSARGAQGQPAFEAPVPVILGSLADLAHQAAAQAAAAEVARSALAEQAAAPFEPLPPMEAAPEESFEAPAPREPLPLEVPVPAPALVAASGPRRPAPSTLASHAARLLAEGRLNVSAQEAAALSGSSDAFRGRTEETLFGFSVRELSAPDSSARIRAAERLRALAHPAAAPALATALHAESDPKVQVALLVSFSAFAHQEGVAIVAPLLSSLVPEVRISALKALISLDPSQAGPHLAAAMKDPDRAVRRRASLLALGLAGPAALQLGEEAIRDSAPEVRSLAALVLGAGGGEAARALLLQALRDPDRKVRQAAAQSLSRMLGHDVSAVVGMDDGQRRREVRRLATLPMQPSTASSPLSLSSPAASVALPDPAPEALAVEPLPPSLPAPTPVSAPARVAPEALCAAVMLEIRSAIRGRTPVDLASTTGAGSAAIAEACELLCARGQVIRRGAKFFAG